MGAWWSSVRVRVGGFAAASLAVATFSPATTLAAHASPTSGGGGRVCTAVSIPVVLNAVLPVQIHGSLCDPSTGPSATIQLLLHGGTYNSDYWDFSYDPQQYSYALAANRAGYSTLDIDRVGYGQSSQVPSALLTGLGQANTIHQIVQQLQEGRIDGVTFPRVMLVGHSLGSGLAVIEAATYHDVAGVVLTGFAHPISPTGTLNAFLNYLYPAALDPKFAGTGVDVGYDTTVPGTRDAFFYSGSDVSPQVLAADEATKDKVSVTEVSDIVSLGFESPLSQAISVPTLIGDGARDGLFCGPLAGDCSSPATLEASQAPYFSPSACLQTFVQPGAGHSIALSLNSRYGFRSMLTWADSYVGSSSSPAVLPDPSCG